MAATTRIDSAGRPISKTAFDMHSGEIVRLEQWEDECNPWQEMAVSRQPSPSKTFANAAVVSSQDL
jgi:hypothetical protein